MDVRRIHNPHIQLDTRAQDYKSGRQTMHSSDSAQKPLFSNIYHGTSGALRVLIPGGIRPRVFTGPRP